MGRPVSYATSKISKGYQVLFADAIRKGADIKTMAVGLIIEPDQAERILSDHSADLIALGRELIANPNWAYHAALALGIKNPYAVLPPSYGFYLEQRAVVIED